MKKRIAIAGGMGGGGVYKSIEIAAKFEHLLMRLAKLTRRPADELRQEFLEWQQGSVYSAEENMRACISVAAEGKPLPWEVSK